MSELGDVYRKISSLKESIYSIKSFLRAEKHVEAFVELQDIESYDIPQIEDCIEFLEHPLYNEAIKYIIEEGCPDLNENICGYLCQDEHENHTCEMCCKNQEGGSVNKSCVERFLHLRMLKRIYSETENKC